MSAALIGYSGFVGGNLLRSESFELTINRANLETLRGARLERVVCAAAPAAKWMANQNPQEDLDNVLRLQDVLATVQAGTFILISTIDVYPCSAGADESYDCSQHPNHAYGANRLQLERFVHQTFPNAHIVRLPALFGAQLKKNILYDLLHDHRLERINPDSRFQWYPLARLPEDIRTVVKCRLPLVNLFTEPLENRRILRAFFPGRHIGEQADPAAHYDLQTRHGALFGGDSRYVMSGDAVMRALGQFLHVRLAS